MAKESASSQTFELEVVTPGGVVLKEAADEALLDAEDGEIGVFPGHMSLISLLKPGRMMYRRGEERTFAAVDGGVVYVTADKVQVMTRNFAPASGLDKASIQQSIESIGDDPTRAPDIAWYEACLKTLAC